MINKCDLCHVKSEYYIFDLNTFHPTYRWIEICQKCLDKIKSKLNQKILNVGIGYGTIICIKRNKRCIFQTFIKKEKLIKEILKMKLN